MISLLILGPGCSRCQQLARATEQAAKELGLEFTLEKITDYKQITALRVMTTPALVVNGTLKIAGRVPSVEEIKKVLTQSDPQ